MTKEQLTVVRKCANMLRLVFGELFVKIEFNIAKGDQRVKHSVTFYDCVKKEE